jgi:predicted cupin superfamily sugar epimerase
MALSSADVIRLLQLRPHPEGGHYRETHRGADLPFELPGRGLRSAGTAIFFLLEPGEFSAFHAVAFDEVWHHYLGSPLELVTIDEAGALRSQRLGSNLLLGESPQLVVPPFVLQAARPLGPGFTLCGCTVAPGFDFADFEMPPREDLVARHPAHRDLITALTRD